MAQRGHNWDGQTWAARAVGATIITGVVATSGCGPKSGQPPQPPGAKLTQPAKRPPAPPPAREVAIPIETATAARAELGAALSNNDPIVRAHAIEAIRQTVPSAFADQLVASIGDRAVIVRVAAAMAVGELRMSVARAALVEHVGDDNDLAQIAVRYALHRLGDTTHSRDLELFSRSDDPRVRGMTVMALGMLEEPTARKLLIPMQADRNAVVRLQVSEALWRLGSEQGLANLAGATVSAYPDDQMVAFLALAQPRDRRVIEHVRGGLVADYEESRLVAARAMGMLGSDEGYAIAAKGTKSPDPRQRVLAALAFGAIGRSDAIDLVTPLLRDANADVRISAATAILQLAGEKPMVEGRG